MQILEYVDVDSMFKTGFLVQNYFTNVIVSLKSWCEMFVLKLSGIQRLLVVKKLV